MSKSRILYAEDEPFLARIVCDALEAAQYEVIHVINGSEVMDKFIETNPQICVLDIMLPGTEGYTIANQIREFAPSIPIIFLSAKTLTEDIVKGFKSGGNDYLKKPFSIDELLVRIESLLTRFGSNETTGFSKRNIYRFGKCFLDAVRHELTTSNGKFTLSFKETAVLEMMLLNSNSVVERNVILKQIWGDDTYYNSRSMDVLLTRIRKLLADEKGIEIMNIRGIGYKLLVPAEK